VIVVDIIGLDGLESRDATAVILHRSAAARKIGSNTIDATAWFATRRLAVRSRSSPLNIKRLVNVNVVGRATAVLPAAG